MTSQALPRQLLLISLLLLWAVTEARAGHVGAGGTTMGRCYMQHPSYVTADIYYCHDKRQGYGHVWVVAAVVFSLLFVTLLKLWQTSLYGHCSYLMNNMEHYSLLRKPLSMPRRMMIPTIDDVVLEALRLGRRDCCHFVWLTRSAALLNHSKCPLSFSYHHCHLTITTTAHSKFPTKAG